jgi:hypothetical protein
MRNNWCRSRWVSFSLRSLQGLWRIFDIEVDSDATALSLPLARLEGNCVGWYMAGFGQLVHGSRPPRAQSRPVTAAVASPGYRAPGRFRDSAARLVRRRTSRAVSGSPATRPSHQATWPLPRVSGALVLHCGGVGGDPAAWLAHSPVDAVGEAEAIARRELPPLVCRYICRLSLRERLTWGQRG